MPVVRDARSGRAATALRTHFRCAAHRIAFWYALRRWADALLRAAFAGWLIEAATLHGCP
jgi:hypothetical protein